MCSFLTLFAQSFARLDATVGDVLSISAENKSEQWKAYGSDETLGSIAGRMESGIHRVLLAPLHARSLLPLSPPPDAHRRQRSRQAPHAD